MLNETLLPALNPLAPGGAWRGVAGEKPTVPYIVFNAVAVIPQMTLSDGVIGRNALVQVDCYARAGEALDALADSIEAAMLAAFAQCVPRSRQDLQEPVTKLLRCMQQFSIWY